MNPDATGSRRNRNSRGEPEEPGRAGRAGRAGGTGTGRAGWDSPGRSEEPDGPEEPEQVGPAGPEIPKRAEQAGTGRNRKSPERKTAPGLIVTDRRGYNNPSDRGLTPGASPNHRTHPSSTGRILVPGRALRAPTGCIIAPQDASFLNRPHPCTPAARLRLQPGASSLHRTHPSSTGRILVPGRAPQAPAGRIPHRRTPHCQTAEHLTAALPNRRTPPGPTPLTPCACSARARYRCAA